MFFYFIGEFLWRLLGASANQREMRRLAPMGVRVETFRYEEGRLRAVPTSSWRVG